MATKLVILDRDGVINHDSAEFIKSPDEFVAIEGSVDAIADLTRAGFTVAVATNQSGLARNLFDEDYAERADFGFGNYRYFVGRPRGAYVELSYQFGEVSR